MSQPLAWSHRAAGIPETGLRETRTATPSERAAVAQTLDLVSCEEIEARYAIRATGAGRYTMSGKIIARLTQTCVVTLDPVAQEIEDGIEVEFWPVGSLPGVGDAEAEVLAIPDVEPIEHGTIETGRIIFETLAAALDPYPRKPGARFEWEDQASAGDAGASGPFAGLKELKDGH